MQFQAVGTAGEGGSLKRKRTEARFPGVPPRSESATPRPTHAAAEEPRHVIRPVDDIARLQCRHRPFGLLPNSTRRTCGTGRLLPRANQFNPEPLEQVEESLSAPCWSAWIILARQVRARFKS